MRYKPQTTKALLMCEIEGTPRIHWFYEKMESSIKAGVSMLIFQCQCGVKRIWGNESGAYSTFKAEMSKSRHED